MRRADVLRVPMADPGDASALRDLLRSGALRAADVVAVMGKTPGNGLTNDHTREFATRTVADTLAEALGTDAATVRRRVFFVLSGGTEGFLSPHLLVFCAGTAGDRAETVGSALATGRGPDLRLQDIGRPAQIEATAAAVQQAMQAAGIAAPGNVAFVQVKCPIPGPAQMHGHTVGLAAETIGGMKGRSRAAGALGVAVGLSEIRSAEAVAVLEGRAPAHTLRACVTAGIDSPAPEVLVLGRASGWVPGIEVGTAALCDPLDAPAVHRLLAGLGLPLHEGQVLPSAAGRLIGMIVKGEPPADDRLRSGRTVLLDDSDIAPVRHYRAALGGVLAAVSGDTHIYLSGGAEHQGPPGGAIVAAFVRRE